MIRDKVDSTPVIDLTGPQGNAYALMALASRYARQLGLDSDAVLAEMQEGNYENLVLVFDLLVELVN